MLAHAAPHPTSPQKPLPPLPSSSSTSSSTTPSIVIASNKPLAPLPSLPTSSAISFAHAQNNSLCSHLSPVLKAGKGNVEAEGSKLRLALRWSFNLAGRNGAVSKRPKLPTPKCATCSLALTRPLLCLECGVVLCGSHDAGIGGAGAHAVTGNHAHSLFLDLHSRALFCTACNDYVYHPIVERCIALELVKHEEAFVVTNSGSATKRKRVPYEPWIAPVSSPTTTFLHAPPRGMRNLGQTCYMSVVLQTFLYNPLLRAYFLSDKHNRLLCPTEEARLKEKGKEGGEGKENIAGKDEEGKENGGGSETTTGKGKPKPCLSCELDRLFEEAYAPESAPFAPTRVLYSVWKCSSELSGYAQQDAHEFLISALNLLHSSAPHSSPLPSCPCIIHTTFSGQLRSSVTCGHCSNVSLSDDPFLDLSLDLRPSRKGDTASAAHAPVLENSLRACLKRFTSPEELPERQYNCAKCGDNQKVASKTLSLHKLPPVLCLQLKRFEHTSGSHKIDNFVKFPLHLDMRPYTSKAVVGHPDNKAPASLYEYHLSSVVCHEGQLNNGHFTTYCRAEDDDFYAFDDEKVRRVPLAEVLASKAYLLTYVRKTLAFA